LPTDPESPERQPSSWVTHQMLNLLASRIMPRTTLDLDPSVLEQLRRRAAIEHKSMGQLASERLAVALRESPGEPAPLRWPSRPMGKARIDLQDKDALWSVLERSEGVGPRRERRQR
jgi:hypothetical protein